jgi:hypothetical protein
MIGAMLHNPTRLVAIGNRPVAFVEPGSGKEPEVDEVIVYTGALAPRRVSSRTLEEVEADLAEAKAAAREASDRAGDLEQVVGAWDLEAAVVGIQLAAAAGAAEAARGDQTAALRIMWEAEAERDSVLERRRLRDVRRRELEEQLAGD